MKCFVLKTAATGLMAVFIIGLTSGCTKKNPDPDPATADVPQAVSVTSPDAAGVQPAPGFAKKNEMLHENQIKGGKNQMAPDSAFSRVLREAIYFSNSLEREALKLILKDRSAQKLTLFSVLSYIVETNSGSKKSTPFGLDCGTFEVRRQAKEILIFKTCVKPEAEVVRIQEIKADERYQVRFTVREWSSVVGWAVALTGSDVKCDLRIRDKKLQSLNCENWSYQTDENQTSSTVMRAQVFFFQREAARQFVIKGGFYKELVENRKIDIVVPLEGKIKIMEKELQVIDEFADDPAVKPKQEEVHETTPPSPPDDRPQEEQTHNGPAETGPQNGGPVPQEAEPAPETGGRSGRGGAPAQPPNQPDHQTPGGPPEYGPLQGFPEGYVPPQNESGFGNGAPGEIAPEYLPESGYEDGGIPDSNGEFIEPENSGEGPAPVELPPGAVPAPNPADSGGR